MVATIRHAATSAGVPAPRKPWLEELAATYDLALLPNPRTDSRLLLGVRDETPAFIDDLFNDSGLFAELGKALPAMLYEYLKSSRVPANDGEEQ